MGESEQLESLRKRMDRLEKQNSKRWDQMIFTRGACHSLAFAIQTYAGGELLLAIEGNWPTHLAVLFPTAKVVDINGVQSLRSFEDRWGKSMTVSRELFIKKYQEKFQIEVDEQMAMNTAEEIIDDCDLESLNKGASDGT